ncbi:MAG: hypothetical protein ABI451_08325, partial [Dokdonella sp.]
WQSVGLRETRHIGAVLIDPRDASTVLVGAVGHYFGPNRERGVFRSSDGGKTWKQTLSIDADTGVVDLAADPANPETVYAAAWQIRNYPWLSYFQPNDGPGSGIYKSTDGGQNWKRLAGGGWPTAILGRIGLATASGGRVYAIVNAEGKSSDVGGLYGSDDGGANWMHVSSEGWQKNDYFARITSDPANRDRLYAVGQSIRRSDDGGKTWTITKGSPGGDDYHDLWINPKHADHMITGSDQGAVVSVNGGQTWSSWYNQPTAQLYHLAVDNRFPYWVYSGQQDSGTVAIASRSDYGALSFRDWHPVGADERDYDIPDPVDPNIVYGSGLGGRLSRWDARTGSVQNISPWPVSSYGARPTSVKYRYTWITPIAVSQTAPYPLYQGAQVLFRSNDHGDKWDVISPDLSAKKAGARDCEKNLAVAKARDCGYGVIFSIGLSPHSNDDIWIGTDDGLVQLTRDAGAHWTNITPKGLPAWGKISSIDVSALDPATAYIAVDLHRTDDFRPQAYRTHDYGKTWTPIVNGLPAGQFVSVVRADTEKTGLLFAGTDQGVHVSFDDGDHWQPLQRNLPTAWVRDLLVHQGDLIAGTQGRAIWMLDNIAPLRQTAEAQSARDAFLFNPAPAWRLRRSENRDTPPPVETPLGENPPAGAIIDYRLGADASGPVALEIYAADGKLVRRFASDHTPAWRNAERYFSEVWVQPQQEIATSKGTHRFVWDLRMPRPRTIGYEYSIAAVFGEDTLMGPLGPLVPPGRYDVALTVGGKTLHAPLDVRLDPRVAIDPQGLQQATAFAIEIGDALGRTYQSYGEIKSLRDQLEALAKKNGIALVAGDSSSKDSNSAATGASSELGKSIFALYASTTPIADGNGSDVEGIPAISETLASLASDIEASDRAPTAPQHAVYADYSEHLNTALDRWKALREHDLVALNAMLAREKMPEIALPTLAEIHFEGPGQAKDLP